MSSDKPYDDSWWLDESALPGRLVWARLRAYPGTAEVLDCDGRVHVFSSETQARTFLLEDEYLSIASIAEAELLQWGLSPSELTPPSSVSGEGPAHSFIVERRLTRMSPPSSSG